MTPKPAEEIAYPTVRFIWSKFFAVVIVGSLVSSIVIWWNAFSTGGLYGGESVELSRFGNCFFLALGAFLGMISAFLPGIIFLSVSDSSRGAGIRTWIISLVSSAILSPLCAVLSCSDSIHDNIFHDSRRMVSSLVRRDRRSREITIRCTRSRRRRVF